MMPRPKARGPNNVVRTVPASELARICGEVFKDQQSPAVAILTGPRNWTYMRRDPDFMIHAAFWPGGEETFCNVPVVINRYHDIPRVMATQRELEAAIFGEEQ